MAEFRTCPDKLAFQASRNSPMPLHLSHSTETSRRYGTDFTMAAMKKTADLRAPAQSSGRKANYGPRARSAAPLRTFEPTPTERTHLRLMVLTLLVVKAIGTKSL